VERARINSERAAGLLVRPNRQLTVGGFLGEWLESKQGRRPATYQGYLHALRPVIQRCGHLPLQALDVPHLETLKRAMLSGAAAGRPGRCATVGPDADPERVGWQAEQVRAFLAHVRGHRLYAAFLLSCCGLRRGEVLGLQLPAVVLTGGRPR
jgi:integrase